MVDQQKNGKLDSLAGSCDQIVKKIPHKTSFWTIDREMVRFKLHFFLLVGGLGTTVPFIPVLAKNRVGITATSMAILLSFERCTCIITKPLLGFVADYFQKLKAMIYILMVLQVISLFLLLAVPKIETTEFPVQKRLLQFPPEILNSSLEYVENSVSTLLSDRCFILSNNDSNICISSVHKSDKSVVCKSLMQLMMENNLTTILTQAESLNKEVHGNVSDVFFKNEQRTNVPIYGCFQNANSFCLMNLKDIADIVEIANENQNINVPSECRTCCKSTKDSPGESSTILSETRNQASKKPTTIAEFQTSAFWLFSAASLCYKVSVNAMITLSDTACCESVLKTGADFGRQRMWAAIGWGLMSPIGGFLSDYTKDFLVQWCVMGVMTLLALWNLHNIQLEKPHFSKNILKDVGTVIKSREFLAFEAGVLMNGVAMGLIWFYLIWFLTSIGGSRLLCGLAQTFECLIGDIPFMFFSGWFIKKLGHFNVLTMAMVAYVVRYFAYSTLENPWLVLPIESLHGFTYGAFFPALAAYGKMSAKPGTEATTQAILFSTHEGLGSGIGSILAGIGFDNLGGHQTFFYAGIVACLFVLFNVLLTLWVRSQKASYKVPIVVDTKTYSASFTFA